MAKNDSIKLKKMAMLKRATKTSTNNKIYLNKYKYHISQWNSISYVRSSVHEMRNKTEVGERSHDVFV